MPAKPYKCCSIVLFSSLLLYSLTVSAAQDERNVLVIYGTGGTATWEQEFNLAFRDELGVELGVYVTPEFLSLLQSDAGEMDLIARSLALKYSRQSIDLVVAVLPEANIFVQDWGDVFAPSAAILHVLPGNDVLARPDLREDRAVVESTVARALAETLDLLPGLFPELENLYVVGGSSARDNSYIQRTRPVIASADPGYNVEYVQGLPPDDLVDLLGQVSENSAVLMTTYGVDNQGRVLRTRVVTAQLANRLDLPIFVNSSPLVEADAFGGSVTSPQGYARLAAEQVFAFFNGNFPAQLMASGTTFMFNGEKLDTFAINRNWLPPDSLIINEPSNLWRDYYPWIVAGIATILLQLLLIGLLLESIRRRRVAEAYLERTRKMEALGSLAGGVAHDFNNILMTVVANAELAGMDNKDDEELNRYLDNILAASDRAKNLIKQILMFSGSAEQESKVLVDVNKLINESIDQFRSFLPENCSIKVQCEAGLAGIRVNTTQFHQLLLNLCVNAQHAIGNSGVITVAAANVSFTHARPVLQQKILPGDYVAISIRDTGSGIAVEDLQRVFEPFYTTKPKGKGTGLGLALVSQIIEDHQGYIDLQSQPDLGTRVTLYFPAQASDLPAQEPQPGRDPVPGRQEAILLVDDDKMVLDANYKNLSGLGYSVRACNNAMEALKEFEQAPDSFDLLFSDLSMPDMDGVRLIGKVREIRPDIPAILCTGHLNSLPALELEKCHILHKPANSAEVSATIFQALNDSARKNN